MTAAEDSDAFVSLALAGHADDDEGGSCDAVAHMLFRAYPGGEYRSDTAILGTRLFGDTVGGRLPTNPCPRAPNPTRP
jgi:hypothetical protein